jgi:putative photosynthetic complex assembly protein 2
MDMILASFFVVFVWWMSTTVILVLTRKNSFLNSISTMLLATAVLILGFFILIFSSNSTDVFSAYFGFVSILMIWAWQETAFLVGWITGNRKSVCPKKAKGLERAWLAFQTISYHELILIILGVTIWMLTLDSPNDIAFKTFFVLWVMRLSAKINVFLGVRNFYEEFLPKKVSYLTTYFKRKSFNPLFPFVLALAAIIDMLFWYHAGASVNSYERASLTLIAALLGLGIIEHIFMMLPFQLDRIWRLGLLKRI